MTSPPLRFDVFLVALDPTLGSGMRRTRPCVVVSPDTLNRPLRTVLIAPMTTRGRAYPYRVSTTFAQTEGHIALDQMRVVNRQRLARHLGCLDAETQDALLDRLQAFFAR